MASASRRKCRAGSPNLLPSIGAHHARAGRRDRDVPWLGNSLSWSFPIPYGRSPRFPSAHQRTASLSLVGALWKSDVTVLGGCGHVGLPLGLALADSGMHVTLYDSNTSAVDRVLAGKMPHLEPGAQEVLLRTLADGTLTASAKPSTVGESENLIVVIGTPVDEHLNPDPGCRHLCARRGCS